MAFFSILYRKFAKKGKLKNPGSQGKLAGVACFSDSKIERKLKEYVTGMSELFTELRKVEAFPRTWGSTSGCSVSQSSKRPFLSKIWPFFPREPFFRDTG